MIQNLGNEIARYEAKKSKTILIKICAIAVGLLSIVAGLYFILNPLDPEDIIMGYVAIGAGFIIPPGAIFLFGRGGKDELTIYEEGVVFGRPGKLNEIHFNDFVGLRDNTSAAGSVLISGNFGMVGGLVAGLVSAGVGAAKDRHTKKYRIRNMSLLVKKNDMAASGTSQWFELLNTGTDELSEVYTNWLIKTNNVTKENLRSLSFELGELEYERGIFVHRRKRGDRSADLSEIRDLKFTEQGELRFIGETERVMSHRNPLAIAGTRVLNIDLIAYIVALANS